MVSVTLWELCVRIYNYNLYFAPNSLLVWLYERAQLHAMTIHLFGGIFGTIAILAIQIGILIYALYRLWKGHHPRIALFMSAFLYLSLIGLHSAATNGGDILIYTSLLFASIIQPYSKISYAVGVLQAAVLYISSAYHKSLSIWLPEGKAVYYVLANDTFGTELGKTLSHFPVLCMALTYFTIVVLYTAWTLFLIPYKNYLGRKIAVLLLVTLHMGLSLNMHIQLIGPIMLSFISLFWIYKDHKHVPLPTKQPLPIAHFVFIYLLIGQALFNFDMLHYEQQNTYPPLKMMNLHLSVSGFKTRYNFFSLDVTKNTWYEVYEPKTGRDLWRGRTLATGQFTKPLAHTEFVVNDRLNRILYLSSKSPQTMEKIGDYFCAQSGAYNITIKRYVNDIIYPESFYAPTVTYSTTTSTILVQQICNTSIR
jgi:hypothetical protein